MTNSNDTNPETLKLLEQILANQESQQQELEHLKQNVYSNISAVQQTSKVSPDYRIDEMHKKIGCLYSYLIFSIVIGVIAFLISFIGLF